MLAILPISTSYQLFGMLHVLAAIGAFGPLFLYPRLQRAGEFVVLGARGWLAPDDPLATPADARIAVCNA